MSSEIAIIVENLSKCYQIYEQPRDRLKQIIFPRVRHLAGLAQRQYFREFWALTDVSIEIRRGETVGIIGRNGSGKSTLLQLISGTLNPTSGRIITQGRIAALLELGSGFNPEFTGRENVYMNAAILGLSQEEINRRFEAIAEFADIREFIEQPVKTYSSGMMVRLAFAVAINISPDILIIDEALAVGDAAFQRKCMRKINELTESGVTLLFVSHDIEAVRRICSKAVYLSRGAVLCKGTAKRVCIDYERDLFGAAMGNNSGPTGDMVDTNSTLDLLDPDLLSINEKTYGDGRVQILDVRVTNKHRQNINVLTPGEALFVSYRAKFLGMSACPIFGMMITNKEGVCVFGTNTDGHPLSSRHYQVGEEVAIEFSLSNNLGPGIYYLTCGIHSGENEDGLIYLQRRMDVLILKCLLQGDLLVAGTANLYPKIE